MSFFSHVSVDISEAEEAGIDTENQSELIEWLEKNRPKTISLKWIKNLSPEEFKKQFDTGG